MARGAAEVALQMQITANDMTGGAFKSAMNKTQRYTKQTKNEFKQLMGQAVSFNKLVGSIMAAKVLSRGMAALEQGIYDVTLNIVDMDQALTSAAAKFGPDVRRGTQAFKAMDAVTRDIAASTQFTSSEVAKGMDFLAMAGFGYEQAISSIRPLTDLATAGQMDLARASDIASDALGAFSMSTQPQDIERNLGRVNDVFAKTVTTSNTTLETLFDTMKMAGPVVSEGVAMFGTLAGALGSAGLKGTVAATVMKNMYLRLQAPPSDAKGALKELGVTVDDGTGRMKNMIDILGELNTAMRRNTQIEKNAYLKAIFGQRAYAGVNVLLKVGKERLKEYYEEIDNSRGAAAAMAEEMRGGLGVQLEILRSTLMAKGMDIFGQLMGDRDAAEAVKELVEVVRQFDVSEIVSGLRTIGGIAKDTAQFMWENRRALIALGKIWIATNLVAKFGAIANSATQMAFALGGSGASTSGSVAGAALSATTNLGAMHKEVGLVGIALRGFVPIVASIVAGIQTGKEIWDWLEEMERKKQEEENKRILASVGKGAKGEDITILEAREQLKQYRKEWDQFEADRRSLGEGGLDLLTGKLSNVREDKQRQLAARRIQKAIDDRWESIRANYRRQYAEYTGGVGAYQTSEDVWRPGMGSTAEDTIARELRRGGLKTESTPTSEMRLTWDPSAEMRVKLDITGLPEGATASATVDNAKAPVTSENMLGVPNG